MNFTFTDDQLALAATVRDVLRAHCPPGALRTERLPGWSELAALGLFGALVPAADEGLGLDLVDVIPALEETGRACLPGPVVETAVAAPYLLPTLAKLASGSLVVAFSSDSLVADADLADLLVVGDRLVSRDAVRLTPQPGADPCRRMFSVAFSESADLPGSAVPALRRAQVATAAQLIGVARHLLETTVEYAKARTQFGAAIGSFQAVKHQLADVAVAVEFAAPLVYRAALTVDERDSCAAKAAAGEAAALAARVALQVHGAIGYTHELDLRFWLARAWSLGAAFGGTAVHRARVRALLGSPARRWP